MGQTGSDHGVPGLHPLTPFSRNFLNKPTLGSLKAQIATIHAVDPLVLVIVIVIGTPLAVVWALTKSAQLRGPAARREPRRPVGSLVTEVITEERPDQERSGDRESDAPPPEPHQLPREP